MANGIGSILAADFGSVTTRVLLIDVVDGVYQLVAQAESRTTLGFPVNDVSVGLTRALRYMSDVTGRTFTNDQGRVIVPQRMDGSGVDYFLTTASAGRPLRAVIIGLMENMSIESALRAISGSYVQPETIIDLADGRNEEERLNALLLTRPDLIFIAGGTDGGAQDAILELARVARLAVDLTDARHKPAVLYAGNRALSDSIRALFDGVPTLMVADNVRPTLNDEELESAQIRLGSAYDDYKEHHAEGFGAVGDMSTSGVLPTAQSTALIVEHLSEDHPGGVVAIDFGAATVNLTTHLHGRGKTTIRADMGLGQSAYNLLQSVGLEEIRRWLPFNASPHEIVNYALNKTLYPGSVPMNVRDLYLEHALLRAGIHNAIHTANPEWYGTTPELELIIASGAALTNLGDHAYTALLMLDALQPPGVTLLQYDPNALLPALGSLARFNPEAVVQVLAGNSLEQIGTAISISGQPKVDSPAMKVKITEEDGQVTEETVLGGHLWIYPAGAGQDVQVDVRAGRGLNINGRRRVKMRVRGGEAGLIFDARGRSIPLGLSAAERAVQLPLWAAEMTGNPPVTIPERWFEDEVELDTSLHGVILEPEPARRGWFGRRRKKAAVRATTETEAAIADRVDDADVQDFMDLIDDSDEDDDELGALRDVLS